jgi:hypothetical protein
MRRRARLFFCLVSVIGLIGAVFVPGRTGAQNAARVSAEDELGFRCRMAKARPDLLTLAELGQIRRLYASAPLKMQTLHQSCKEVLGSVPKSGPAAPGGETERIFPWPPPVATDSLTGRGLPRVLSGKLKTVGDVANLIDGRLTEARFTYLRYWGAPGGFALVTRVEPIDAQARRVGGPRVAQNVSPKWSIISDVWEGMMAAPADRQRIFLFVLTNDPKAAHGDKTLRQDYVSKWTNEGQADITVAERAVALGEDHLLLIFVYEFAKNRKGELELLSGADYSGRIWRHLEAAELNITDLLKR